MSSAPAPSLAPATIAYSSIVSQIVEILHSPEADPNLLFFNNARDLPSLRNLAKFLVPFVEQRNETILGHVAASEKDEIQVSGKTLQFWKDKLLAFESVLSVMKNAEKDDSALSSTEKQARDAYFKQSVASWEGLKEKLVALNKEIIGPLSLGK